MRKLSVPQNKFLDALTCQGEFSHLTNPRVLYGGSGYGGKSYAIRSAAVELNGRLRDLGYPQRWGAIFCSDYPKLMDRHGKYINRELAEYGRIQKSLIHGLHFKFYDESMGGFYLRNTKDPTSYRGIEYDWILFDELTEVMRDDFDNIMYLLRSEVKGGLPFESFGAATNPDGPGHGWVKEFWINRNFDGETDLLKEMREEFIFIPAKATDNPVFSNRIAAKLQGFSDPALVKARWEGSWDLASGVRFSFFKRPIHTFDWDFFCRWYGTSDPQKTLMNKDMFVIVASLDYGTDVHASSAFLIHAIDWKGKKWTIHEEYMCGYFLREQAEVIRELVKMYGITRIFADPSLDTRESDGISRRMKFKQFGVSLFMAINDRVEGWASVERALDYRMDPVDDSIELYPELHIHRDCHNTIRQLVTAPRSERRPEDVDITFRDDHAIDSLRYFIHSFALFPRGPQGDPLEISEEAFRKRYSDG